MIFHKYYLILLYFIIHRYIIYIRIWYYHENSSSSMDPLPSSSTASTSWRQKSCFSLCASVRLPCLSVSVKSSIVIFPSASYTHIHIYTHIFIISYTYMHTLIEWMNAINQSILIGIKFIIIISSGGSICNVPKVNIKQYIYIHLW